MLYPRVMGDAVHLPDDTLFICNGGQQGKHCCSCAVHFVVKTNQIGLLHLCSVSSGAVFLLKACKALHH